MSFWQRLTRTTRLLGLLFLALAALNLWKMATYRPWDSLPLRLSYTDAHGYPVYSDSTEFLADGQRITKLDCSFRGPVDSVIHGARREYLGTWISNVEIVSRRLRFPNQLRVDYTSLAEGRSYRGLFTLPQRRLDSLLTGMQQHPERYTPLYAWNDGRGLKLQAGLAPGGVVLVRLLGDDYQVEVARFQAQPYPTHWPKPQAYHDKVAYRSLPELRRLLAHAERTHLDSLPAVPLALWDTLRTRYDYCLRVLVPVQTYTLHVGYLNEDEEGLNDTSQASCRLQPLPAYIRYVVSESGFLHPYRHTLFDPTELRGAFAQLRRTAAPGEQFELQVVPTPVRVRVYLKSQRQTIELTRAVTDTGL